MRKDGHAGPLFTQLQAAGLSYAEVSRLSNGILTDSKLRKANAGLQDLTAEDAELFARIVNVYRMAHENLKVAITSFSGVRRNSAQAVSGTAGTKSQ